jgi:hypothetical protein
MNPEPTIPPEKQSFWTTLPGILAQLAVLIGAITALIALLLPHCHNGSNSSPTPIPSPTIVGGSPSPKISNSITVLGIQAETKEQSDGRYFNFDAADLEAILGRRFYDSEQFVASRDPEAPRRPIVVFRGSPSGAGDARGRYIKWRPNDWKPGDHVYVFPPDK